MVYFRNRAGSLYTFPLRLSSTQESPLQLPPSTVLDGELIWVGGQGFFLAFDALAVGQDRVWQQPLWARTAALQNTLRLVEAEACEELLHAATLSSAAPPPPPGMIPGFSKKQQAPPPGRDTVTLVYKRHLEVTGPALVELEATRGRCPYPTNGLVFTPNSMPYALGMAELLRKWQPAEQAAGDVQWCGEDRADAQSVEPSASLVAGLVYECLPTGGAGGAGGVRRGAAAGRFGAYCTPQRRAWRPVSIRWDKPRGNSAAALAGMVGRAASGEGLGHGELVRAVARGQALAAAHLVSRRPDVPAQRVILPRTLAI
jgi:hypothetical protein